MSLINDMLQDLDREDVRDEPVLPAGLATEKPAPSASPRRYLLPGLAAVALAYGLLVEMNLLGLMPEKKPPVMDIPQPIALNSKWLNQPAPADTTAAAGIGEPIALKTDAGVAAPENLVAPKAQEAVPIADVGQTETVPESFSIMDAVTTTPATTIPVTAAPAVEPLLDAANLALVANRLTTPVGDNAYELFKSALVIDPQNATAQAGVESIRQRYLVWLDKALTDGRVAAARLYVQKARSVGVDNAVLATYEDRLTPIPSTSVPDAIPVVEILPQATITPAKMADDTAVAERIRVSGLRAEAEALQLISHTRAVPQTAVALADVYVERQARAELRRLADLLANKTESAYAYVAAQLWLLDDQERRAIDALSSVEFTGLAERQRQRLLAGLRQRAGEYAEAMELYTGLVAASPESVSDWLGLAVSADRSRLINTALDAYEKVLSLRHPDQRVMQFARQRRQDLSLAAITDR